MVDAVDVTVFGGQQVAALSIGVVGQCIEDADPAQSIVGLDDHLQHVRFGVGLDPQLDHSPPVRAVTQDRRRDDSPACRFREQVRSGFAIGQRADGEVVERPLAAGGLVDSARVVPSIRHRNVAFDASVSRPMISIRPRRSSSSAVGVRTGRQLA